MWISGPPKFWPSSSKIFNLVNRHSNSLENGVKIIVTDIGKYTITRWVVSMTSVNVFRVNNYYWMWYTLCHTSFSDLLILLNIFRHFPETIIYMNIFDMIQKIYNIISPDSYFEEFILCKELNNPQSRLTNNDLL